MIVSLRKAGGLSKNFIGGKAYYNYIMQKHNINIVDGVIVYGNLDESDLMMLDNYTKSDKLYCVRSSMGDEDGINKSQAGKYTSYLAITKAELKDTIKCVLELSDSKHKAVLVQPLIFSEVSGVLFTKCPVTGANKMIINACLGTGENVVSGTMEPDEYEVDYLNKKIINKSVAMRSYTFAYGKNEVPGTNLIYNNHRLRVVISNQYKLILSVHFEDRNKPILTDEQIWQLTEVSANIREIMKCEQDIEFAIYHNEIYILQARPITVINNLDKKDLTKTNSEKQFTGQRCSLGIFTGRSLILDSENASKLNDKFVLITDELLPKYLYSYENMGAIITTKAGVLSHAAIVARELGIPCVVGLDGDILKITDGSLVRVDAYNGRVEVIDEITGT